MEYTPKYLIYVDGLKANSNKQYHMIPKDDGTFDAIWGRVGGHLTTTNYPMSKWNSQYKSKIKKGYIDQTDLMQDIIENSKVETNENNQDEFSLIENKKVRDIIKRLFDYANKSIQSAYKVSSNMVTQAMVDKAQEKLDELAKNVQEDKLSLDEFNKRLIEIFGIIPRKMKMVSDYLAINKVEFNNILKNEQDILDTMAGQVYKPEIRIKADNILTGTQKKATQNMLDKMGIKMEPVEDVKEIEMLKKQMGNQANKFYAAWRVQNIETEDAFNTFVKDNKINNIKLLCHGSRNQNWFNIVKMGLKIRPAGAGYNGSMYSDGLYFGNPDKENGGFQKSVGYTSLGGYWTREYENCGFVAFFDVALGEYYDIYQREPWHGTGLNLQKLQSINPKCFSTFAHGGTGAGIINDEIIVYDSCQMTVRYLVEIRNN